mmetsp:Transcript_28357/g.66334  ORF Transcript_28357/g.66334 Transcript_28357/m.66334 type:complete len:527 (+) Transcript_28357:79-1659(+)
MNNEGLEALAALAAAAPAPSTGNVNEGEANKKDREKAAVVAESLPGAEPVDMAAAPAATNLPAHLAAQLQANPAQLHHLRAFGAQLQGAGPNPTAPELALLAASQLQQLPQQRNDISALQNMAYHHLLLQTQQAAAPQQPTAAAQISNTALTAAATQLASLLGLSQTAGNPAAAVNAHALLSATTAAQSKAPSTTHNTPAATQLAAAAQSHAGLLASPAAATPSAASTSMPPPPRSAPSSPAAVAAPKAKSSRSGPGPSLPRSLPTTAKASSVSSRQSSRDSVAEEDEHDDAFHSDDKKEQKRAANRRSAQLSRKRKKQFIEELKDENDDLRRKEQILKSIPDLVVVFDSTGKLWFVSQSISRFIQFNSNELERTSFWDRLCPESVRLLKAAFMDSLAARESHTDTVPLGSGLWDLRLLDKNGSLVTVTLNGVVHFAGERPECVCCIRPKDDGASSSSDGEKAEERPRAVKRQALISDSSTLVAPNAGAEAKVSGKQRGKGREAIRISDSCNSSGSGGSVSGSSDE